MYWVIHHMENVVLMRLQQSILEQTGAFFIKICLISNLEKFTFLWKNFSVAKNKTQKFILIGYFMHYFPENCTFFEIKEKWNWTNFYGTAFQCNSFWKKLSDTYAAITSPQYIHHSTSKHRYIQVFHFTKWVHIILP